MKKIKFFMSLLKGHRVRYFTVIFLGIIISMAPLVSNYLIKTIIDDVICWHNYSIFMPILITLFSITLIRMLVWYYNHYTIDYVGQVVLLNLRQQGYKKILSLDFDFFDKNRTGDIMTQMTADIDFIRHMFAYVIYAFIENFVIFTGALIVMLATGHKSFYVILAIVLPTVGYLGYKLANEVRPCFRRVREMRSELNTIVQENISANRVVKAFGREDFENEKLEEANSNFKHAQFHSNEVSRKYMPYMSNMQSVLIFYNIIVGGILVINGNMTMGQLVMFNSMVWMVTGPLGQFGFLLNDFANCLASTEKIIDLLHTEPVIKNIAKINKTAINGDFEFKNVTFDYKSEGALRNVSFKVKKGQKVAIVGSTGSGKSTVINLISRFYEADSGEILIDGVNVSDIDLELLRSSIAVAQQDVFLFSETIAKNIAYGNTSATMDEITSAAKIAKAHDFITKLPEGYETIIGERGMGLSGGQKQRLTLARALLKKPSVLVLDDTTSALDANTEKYIQQQLKCYFKDKTVFIISQRISSVKDCDLILVLEDGKITEQGRHGELIQNGGYYARVYEHQFGDFAGLAEVNSNG